MIGNNELSLGMEDRLEEALVMLATGVPLETVLAQAGEDAEELRPLLQMAVEIEVLQPLIPIPPPNASLQKMMTHAEKLAGASSPDIPVQVNRTTGLANLLSFDWQRLLLGSFRMATLTAGLVIVFLLGSVFGGGVGLAAQESLPGQPFYGLKRMGETIHLTFTQNRENRERLLKTYNRRRQMETELLLEQGQEAGVAFAGDIQSVTDSRIGLAGLTVQIRPDTEIKGELVIGARVYLEAVTQPPDGLIAVTITVIEPAPPTPTSTPTPTTTPTATPTITVTPGITLTPTPPASQANDTFELSPTPTATSILDDDTEDNDNTDDNGQNDDDFNDDDENSNDNEDDDENDNDNSDDDNSGSGSDDDDSDEESDDDNSGEGSDDDISGSGHGDDNSGEGSDDDSGSGSDDGEKDDDDDDDD